VTSQCMPCRDCRGEHTLMPRCAREGERLPSFSSILLADICVEAFL